MIEQCLSNKNENATMSISKNLLNLNKAQVLILLKCTIRSLKLYYCTIIVHPHMHHRPHLCQITHACSPYPTSPYKAALCSTSYSTPVYVASSVQCCTHVATIDHVMPTAPSCHVLHSSYYTTTMTLSLSRVMRKARSVGN